MKRFFLPVAIFVCAFCMIVGIGALVGVVGLQTQAKQDLQHQLDESDKAIGRLISDIVFLEEAYVAAVDARDAAVAENAQLKADLIAASVVPDADDVLAPLQSAKATPATTIPESLVSAGNRGPTIILPAP